MGDSLSCLDNLVFEPLVIGGSFNFQLPLRGGSSCVFFLWGLAHI